MELLEKGRSRPTAAIAQGYTSINGLMDWAVSDVSEMLLGFGEQRKQLKEGGDFREVAVPHFVSFGLCRF